MSKRFLIFTIITVAVVAAAWKTSKTKAPETNIVSAQLFPDLFDRVNDVATLTVQSADHKTELARDGEKWVVANRDNFEADYSAVKRTLLKLADTEIVEEKTSKAENYNKLGVADLSGNDNQSVQIAVAGEDNEQFASLIIGNERDSTQFDSPTYFVRKTAEPNVWLVAGDLDINADPQEWMDTELVNIDTKRVRRVALNRNQETPVVISKDAATDNFFTLQAIPTGFTTTSRASVSSIGALLLDVNFEDVARANRVEGLLPRAIAVIETFDGLEATLEQFDYESNVYVRFQFAFNADNVVEEEPAQDEAQSDDSAAGESEMEAEEAVSVEDEVAALNEKVAGWVYVLPDYKVRMIDKRFDDLIKPAEEEKPAAEDGDSE